MKAVITGPRSSMSDDLERGWMHIEIDLEELPRYGQTMILNSGGSYIVTDIMWWIDGPENDAYWSHTADYNVQGQFQTVHVVVEPAGPGGLRNSAYTMAGARREGQEQGKADAVRQLQGRLDELDGMPDVVRLAVVTGWLKANAS